MNKISKGLSVLLLGFIVLAGIILGLMYIRYGMATYTKDVLDISLLYNQYIERSSSISVQLELSETHTKLINKSPIPINPFIIFIEKNGKITPIVLTNNNSNCTSTIYPMQSCVVFSPLRDISSIITRDGLIIRLEKINMIVESGYLIKMHQIPLNVRTIDDLSIIFNIPREQTNVPYINMSTSIARTVLSNITYVVELNESMNNALIEANMTRFGLVAIGIDPTNINKYNLLIVVPNNNSPGNRTNITINNNPILFNTSRYNSDVLRVRIDGFVPDFIRILNTTNFTNPSIIACNNCLKDIVGLWYYGIITNMSLSLKGYADRVTIMRGIDASRAQSIANRTWNNYYPYLFIGDIDKNALIDVLLITEDCNYGDSSMINDRNPINPSRAFLDQSLIPLRLYINLSSLTNDISGEIDANEYQGLVLYINAMFHDNVHPDNQTIPTPSKSVTLFDITEIRDIMRILLIDMNGNAYIARTVSISELYVYHQTLIRSPELEDYFKKAQITSYILLPESGRYKLAIELEDPYLRSNNINDADITVGLDILTMIPLKR